jgi:hypothetical protein
LRLSSIPTKLHILSGAQGDWRIRGVELLGRFIDVCRTIAHAQSPRVLHGDPMLAEEMAGGVFRAMPPSGQPSQSPMNPLEGFPNITSELSIMLLLVTLLLLGFIWKLSS